jgi:Sulfatase
LNATFQRNHDPPVSHTGEYSTDILAQKAYGFLDDAVTAGKPFFLGIAPVACHSNVILPLTATELPIFTAPIPAKRHEDLFPDAIVPRTESFNPDQVCKSYLFLQGLSYRPVYIAILLLSYSALLYVSSTNIKYAQIFLSKKVALILTSDFSLLVPTG